MPRPTDAIVTGFTKNGELCVRAFASLLQLRQEGAIRAIHYVTWDSGEIEAFVAPVAQMDGVTITRVPQPVVSGNANQRGIVYQVRNLDAALACIPQGDALVVKLRPDFVFAPDFLRNKLRDFDRLCMAPAGATAWGVKLPRLPLLRKIWIPWADAGQPFFYEDAAFIGLKGDIARLAIGDVERAAGLLGDMSCGSLAHVLRYVDMALPRFPIFRRYIENYGAFANDLDYRRKLVAMAMADSFFWHLIVAHAWILWTSFHIDCGTQGELSFFPNTANAGSDWRAFDQLKLAPPYDYIAQWRNGTRAGEAVLPCLLRIYARLMDDAWPKSLFTQSHNDIRVDRLKTLAQGVADYAGGALGGIEDTFYAKLAAFHREHWRAREAA